jgi:DNA-binding IclR family transcriptional regulator
MQQINHAARSESRPGNIDEYILSDPSTSRGMLFPYRNAAAPSRQGGWFRNAKRRSATVQQGERMRPLRGGGLAEPDGSTIGTGQAAGDWPAKLSLAAKGDRVNKIQSGANRSSYWVPILGSAMRILDVFYEADADLTLHEISAKAKVGKTSAFRILFTLDSVGYVEKDPASGKYRLGLGIIEAARKTLAGRDLVQVARPHLKKLRDEFEETTNLAALKDDKIVYLEIFESHHSFRMTDTVGSRVPWHSTALGKSIAAFLDQEKLKAVLKQSARKRFTPHTITGVREYSRELAKVREQGYSLDNEESELGATCVASPIFSGDNVVVGALSVSGPTPRIRDKQNKITAALKEASAAISRSVSADRSDR